jgi:hypothetical protein
MKKLIALLAALTTLFSMTATVSADWIPIDNPEDYLTYYVNFERYGFSGYYNDYCFDGENHYVYNPETGKAGSTYSVVGYWIHNEDGVYYMYSRRIEGEEIPERPGMKKAPLADVLANIPRYEYKLEDLATLQKYLMTHDIRIDFHNDSFLDYNADKELTSVDLSLIKYELLH